MNETYYYSHSDKRINFILKNISYPDRKVKYIQNWWYNYITIDNIIRFCDTNETYYYYLTKRLHCLPYWWYFNVNINDKIRFII